VAETLEIQGHIVPVADTDPQRHFSGRVRFDGAVVDKVLTARHAPSSGVRQIDVGDAFVYPGLTDLHSHLAFATLPLWHEPARTSGPWLHRDLWPSAPSYKPGVSWPAYAYLKGAPEALLAYAQVRALAGGTTTIQGWPNANGNPANLIVRSVDDGVDPDSIRTSVINLTSAELDDRRALLDEGRSLVYHLCEGQRGSKVAREFTDVATAGCLRHRLIAIHCCAVGDEEFRQWNVHADLSDNASPGGVVWSPFSNLWLYDQTTDVMAARAHGVLVCIGSDWGPSGSKNLLGELKVAHTWVRHAGLDLTPFDLAEMVTSNPGDLLARAWAGQAPGRLQPGRMADAVVVSKRHDDPWTNLVLARESDIMLVVGDGRARYGTPALMKAAGETTTTSMRVGSTTKHFGLRRPDDPAKTWTWSAVMGQLRTVQANPVAAIEQGLAIEAIEADVTMGSTGSLILESDMPGGPNSVAGPPPPGTTFDAPPLPTLIHDDTWFGAVRAAGYHNHVLDDLDRLFADDAVLA
jgi:cytosine/adenosine deaminase-related metal-dependent hydrolase